MSVTNENNTRLCCFCWLQTDFVPSQSSSERFFCSTKVTFNISTVFCSVFKGPFTDINSEEVEEEIGSMYRTVLKLTKTFSDAPGPRRVADSVKSKVDKFKVHIPLLQIICNPGLRERHWEQVSVYLMPFVYLSVFVYCLDLSVM